jgi:integrase
VFAEHYGALARPQAERLAQAEAAFVMEIAGLVAGQSAIDVGCGDGRHAGALSDSGVRMVGLDASAAQLRAARAFYAWCIERDYLDRNPFERVKGTGRAVSGKPQLRLDEVRQLVEVLQCESSAGDEGASGLLLQLVLGARSSEILSRQVRDVDDGGRVLWIPDGKTKNARRRLSVPEEVQPLLQRLMRQRSPEDFLIGEGRSKPYTSPVLWKRLRRFCSMAGIPQVCPHSLRGLHSTLAIEAGATSGAVIAQLGHSSFHTTERHYLDKDRRHDASMRRVAGTLLSPRDELAGELADLSADEVRELLAAIRSRRHAA